MKDTKSLFILIFSLLFQSILTFYPNYIKKISNIPIKNDKIVNNEAEFDDALRNNITLIALGNNITFTSTKVISSKSLTIDLNNYDIFIPSKNVIGFDINSNSNVIFANKNQSTSAITLQNNASHTTQTLFNISGSSILYFISEINILQISQDVSDDIVKHIIKCGDNSSINLVGNIYSSVYCSFISLYDNSKLTIKGDSFYNNRLIGEKNVINAKNSYILIATKVSISGENAINLDESTADLFANFENANNEISLRGSVYGVNLVKSTLNIEGRVTIIGETQAIFYTLFYENTVKFYSNFVQFKNEKTESIFSFKDYSYLYNDNIHNCQAVSMSLYNEEISKNFSIPDDYCDESKFTKYQYEKNGLITTTYYDNDDNTQKLIVYNKVEEFGSYITTIMTDINAIEYIEPNALIVNDILKTINICYFNLQNKINKLDLLLDNNTHFESITNYTINDNCVSFEEKFDNINNDIITDYLLVRTKISNYYFTDYFNKINILENWIIKNFKIDNKIFPRDEDIIISRNLKFNNFSVSFILKNIITSNRIFVHTSEGREIPISFFNDYEIFINYENVKDLITSFQSSIIFVVYDKLQYETTTLHFTFNKLDTDIKPSKYIFDNLSSYENFTIDLNLKIKNLYSIEITNKNNLIVEKIIPLNKIKKINDSRYSFEIYYIDYLNGNYYLNFNFINGYNLLSYEYFTICNRIYILSVIFGNLQIELFNNSYIIYLPYNSKFGKIKIKANQKINNLNNRLSIINGIPSLSPLLEESEDKSEFTITLQNAFTANTSFILYDIYDNTTTHNFTFYELGIIDIDKKEILLKDTPINITITYSTDVYTLSKIILINAKNPLDRKEKSVYKIDIKKYTFTLSNKDKLDGDYKINSIFQNNNISFIDQKYSYITIQEYLHLTYFNIGDLIIRKTEYTTQVPYIVKKNLSNINLHFDHRVTKNRLKVECDYPEFKLSSMADESTFTISFIGIKTFIRETKFTLYDNLDSSIRFYFTICPFHISDVDYRRGSNSAIITYSVDLYEKPKISLFKNSKFINIWSSDVEEVNEKQIYLNLKNYKLNGEYKIRSIFNASIISFLETNNLLEISNNKKFKIAYKLSIISCTLLACLIIGIIIYCFCFKKNK